METRLRRTAALIAGLSLSAAAHVTLVAPEGGETLSGGKVFTVVWDADSHDCVYNLYYSGDGGATFKAIVLGLGQDVRSYKWTVPDSATAKGMVRVLQDNKTGSDLDDRSKAFAISASAGIQGFPGPAGRVSAEFGRGQVTVALRLEAAAPVSIRAIDALGAALAEAMEASLPAGTHRLAYPAAFPARPWILRVRIGDQVRNLPAPALE